MITFEINEEESMLKKTAEDFAKVLREGMRKWEKEGVSSDLIKEYRKIGFGLVDVPSDMGGLEAGFFKKALLLEELSWGCAGATLRLELPTILLHLLRFAEIPNEDKQKIVEEIMNSEKVPFGVYVDADEGIEQDSDGKFSGKAWNVLGRDFEKFILLKNGKLFFFSSDSFRKTEKKPLAFDAVGISEVILENSSPYLSTELLDKGIYFISVVRFYLSCIGAGILRASFEYASKYAMEREAFGKKIAHHQGMAFILSDFSIAVSSAQLYSWKCAYELDKHFTLKPETQTSSSAGDFPSYFLVSADSYSFVCEVAEKFTVWGVQILGGHGFVKDHPVEKWMREGKAISLIFGGKHNAELDSEKFIA